MTRERRLAIQMWEEIKYAIIKAERVKDIDGSAVRRMKSIFCFNHNLRWFENCWLCHYVRYHDELHGEGCQRCPLSDGHKEAIIGVESGCYKNAYNRVIHAQTRNAKLKACDEIIRILNGRLK